MVPVFTNVRGGRLWPFSFCTELLLGAAITHQMWFNPEVFPDSLISGTECLRLTQCFVTVVSSSKSVFMVRGYCQSSHHTGPDHQTQRLGAEQELSISLFICKMPHIRTLVCSGPSVCCSCGIRRISITEIPIIAI